ncbi:unnamed protein product [Chrysoparadoxa australica]
MLFACTSSLAYTLSVRSQPGQAKGGEPFREQPQVEIYNGATLDTTFQGYVTAELYSSPEGWEGLDPGPDANAATFTNLEGRATFSGLTIDGAGEGFILRFVAYNSFDVGVAYTESEPFEVLVGDPYQLDLLWGAGTIFGGGNFDLPPTVAVQDKGGNDLSSLSDGSALCWLSASPAGAILEPEEYASSDIILGHATFPDLSLDLAGEYMLSCNTTLSDDLEGTGKVDSPPFTVGVGPASYMTLIRDPVAGAAIVAGESFPEQPLVGVYDAGGNLLAEDSLSAVLVTIDFNPGGAELGPNGHNFEVLRNGKATFNSLYLSKKGHAFILRFSHYIYDSISDGSEGSYGWIPTGVELVTSPFDVSSGPASYIGIARKADGSWAGGRGFNVQPQVALFDKGGKTAKEQPYDTMPVTAYLVPSLSVSNSVVIDTSADPTVTVESIGILPQTDGTYGVGQTFDISITMTGAIDVDTDAQTETAKLEMNAKTSTMGTIYAELITPSSASKVITFRYQVAAGDQLTGAGITQLDYTATPVALHGVVITDMRGTAVDLTLPTPDQTAGSTSIPGSAAIALDTSAPTFTGATTTAATGTYGAGHVIGITVTCSKPVHVNLDNNKPAPLLRLNLATSGEVKATYISGSDTDQLYFEYQVQEGDAGMFIAATLSTAPSGVNVELPVSAWGAAATILQASSSPTLAVNLAATLLVLANAVTIDTSQPMLDEGAGVTASSGAGAVTYMAYDTVDIMVPFTAPLSVAGDVGLRLNTGGRAEYLSGGNDGTSSIITFRYTIQPGESTGDLNYSGADALELGGNGSIQRYSSNPTQAAALDLQPTTDNNKSLGDQAAITIDGAAPAVVSVVAVGGTYGVDATVAITVTFDKSIEVTGVPVLALQTTVPREATYVSGTGTTALVFHYTTSLADDSLNLGFRYFPNALCVETGCPETSSSSITEKTTSGAAGQEASLALDNSAGSAAAGVALGGVVVSTSGSRVTTVASVATTNAAGSYGVGGLVHIALTFIDEVVIESGTPSLALNNGATAIYVDGDGSKAQTSLKHTHCANQPHRTMPAIPRGEAQWVHTCGSPWLPSLSLGCTSHMANDEDYTLDPRLHSYSMHTFINVGDLLCSPCSQVTGLKSLKVTSPWDGLYYPGEEMELIVTFDLPVEVWGTPTLALDSGNVAEYSSTSADGLEVTYQYTAMEGDASSELKWASTDAMAGNAAGSLELIFRQGSDAMVLADLTLPDPTLLKLAQGANSIVISDSAPAAVTSITCSNGAGTYAAGDVLLFDAIFDKHVMVEGTPTLLLNIGMGRKSRAKYISGSGTKASSK